MGHTALLTVLALAVTAVGCSDDDDGDSQAYVEALSESLQGDEAEGAVLDQEQADCAADITIEALGGDFLEENDVTPAALAEADDLQDLDFELSEDQARGAAMAFVECDLPLGELFVGPDATVEAVDCIEEHLDEDVLVDGLTAELLGNTEEAAELLASSEVEIQEACADVLAG